jgi:DNA-directed RNA polymerase sigma subunit (sigma70/sigma32)
MTKSIPAKEAGGRIRVPVLEWRSAMLIRRCRKEYQSTHSRRPSDQEVSEIIGWPIERIRAVEAAAEKMRQAAQVEEPAHD